MPNSKPTEVDEGPECCIGISARHRFLISQSRIRHWIFEVHCMSHLWTFEPEIPDNLGAVMLWKVVILKRKSTFNLWHHWRFCHPRMYRFLMANSWLVIKAKGLAKHLQHFNATSRMMLDQIWKRSNFSCNILDVAWCCNRLVTFTQHCCTRACALGALVARHMHFLRTRDLGHISIDMMVENVENVACVWPARSTHIATSCNNV